MIGAITDNFNMISMDVFGQFLEVRWMEPSFILTKESWDAIPFNRRYSLDSNFGSRFTATRLYWNWCFAVKTGC